MPKQKLPPMTQIDTLNVVIKEKGLVIKQIAIPLYLEKYTADDGQPHEQEVIILNAQGKRYKLAVNTDEDYALKGTVNSTIYILYQRNQQERFRQLSLKDMGMDPQISKPLNEDMGKVLSKIFKDNLDAKKKPASMIAGLTKTLFYAFIFSIIVYSTMYSINLFLTGLALHAFNTAAGAINKYMSTHPYTIAPVVTTTTIIANSITTNAVT